MQYKMFIDDERFPITDDWVIVRSSLDAAATVLEKGFPVEISFDHDLGGDDTSMIFIKWMIEQILDGALTIPYGFRYNVHSQNPVGAANIKGTMDGILNNFGPKE